MIGTRIRPVVRAAAGIAAVAALAAGCGSETDEGQEVPVGEPGIEQDDQGASDGGGESDDGTSDSDASDDGTSGGTSDDGTSDDADESATGAAEPLPADADLATETLPVTAEDAWEIALEATGGGEVLSIEIDYDDGLWEWEFEIQNNGEEHELDIDATTGEITDHERETDDDDDPAVDITSPMTYQEAIEIALGEQDGRVEGWELESDDGRIEYTIDIERGDGEDVEVEVDVETGETRIDD